MRATQRHRRGGRLASPLRKNPRATSKNTAGAVSWLRKAPALRGVAAAQKPRATSKNTVGAVSWLRKAPALRVASPLRKNPALRAKTPPGGLLAAQNPRATSKRIDSVGY